MNTVPRFRLMAGLAALGLLLASCGREQAVQSAQPSSDGAADIAAAYGQCPDRSRYMGCAVPQATAGNGAVGNALLVEQYRRLAEGVHPVSTQPGRRVWSIVGIGLAAATVIEADQSLIVVDTGEDMQQARRHIAHVRRLSDKPVRAVIYSHWHYSEGTAAYEQAWPDAPLQVWGHESLHALKSRSIGALGLAMARRAWRHFGVDLPASGPDALLGVGIGNRFIDLADGPPESGYRPPNRPVRGDGETHVIDGVRLQFFNHASDSSDALVIWLPEVRVAVNNHVWNVLPNLYSLRGGRYRDPADWIAALDRILSLEPVALANVHGLPTVGERVVRERVIAQRDAMQFIHDQTVRWINRGLHVEDIVERVRLPAPLRLADVNRQNYGETAHHVRGVYHGLMGWFSEDAVEINPLPRAERARRIVAGFGGMAATRAMAEQALAAGEHQWAAELTAWMLLVQPDEADAARLQARALRAMAQATPAGSTRNFLLTQALHREGRLDMHRPSVDLIRVERLRATPPGTFVEALRYAVDPDVAGPDMVFGIRFTDTGDAFGLTLRNGVAVFSRGMPDDPDLALHTPRELWLRLLIGDVHPALALAGELDIGVGDLATLKAFFDRFDRVRR